MALFFLISVRANVFRRNLKNELDYYGITSISNALTNYAAPRVRHPHPPPYLAAKNIVAGPYRPSPSPSRPPPQTPPLRPVRPRPLAPPHRHRPLGRPPTSSAPATWSQRHYDPRHPAAVAPTAYRPLEDNYATAETFAPTPTARPRPPTTPASFVGVPRPRATTPATAATFVRTEGALGGGYWRNRLDVKPTYFQEEAERDLFREAVYKPPAPVTAMPAKETAAVHTAPESAFQLATGFGPTSFGLPWEKHTRRRKLDDFFPPSETFPAKSSSTQGTRKPASKSGDLFEPSQSIVSSNVAATEPFGKRRRRRRRRRKQQKGNRDRQGQGSEDEQQQQQQRLWRRLGPLSESVSGSQSGKRRRRKDRQPSPVNHDSGLSYHYYRPQHTSEFRHGLY